VVPSARGILWQDLCGADFDFGARPCCRLPPRIVLRDAQLLRYATSVHLAHYSGRNALPVCQSRRQLLGEVANVSGQADLTLLIQYVGDARPALDDRLPRLYELLPTPIVDRPRPDTQVSPVGP
jgi:hypothetical protein